MSLDKHIIIFQVNILHQNQNPHMINIHQPILTDVKNIISHFQTPHHTTSSSITTCILISIKYIFQLCRLTFTNKYIKQTDTKVLVHGNDFCRRCCFLPMGIQMGIDFVYILVCKYQSTQLEQILNWYYDLYCDACYCSVQWSLKIRYDVLCIY